MITLSRDIEKSRDATTPPAPRAPLINAAALQGKAAGPVMSFQPRQECDRGVAHRDASKIIVIGAQQVEQVFRARAVEDDFAVTCPLDDDRLVLCGRSG